MRDGPADFWTGKMGPVHRGGRGSRDQGQGMALALGQSALGEASPAVRGAAGPVYKATNAGPVPFPGGHASILL